MTARTDPPGSQGSWLREIARQQRHYANTLRRTGATLKLGTARHHTFVAADRADESAEALEEWLALGEPLPAEVPAHA